MMSSKWTFLLPSRARDEEITRLSQLVESLKDKLLQQQAELRSALEQRRQSEDALRSSEERYVLATRGANDGLWEWDIRDDTIVFSPRWKNLIGLSDEELPNSREAWRQRVHPADLRRVETALKEYLDGTTPRYEQ